ncbi:hypothetical protein GCM10023185_43030 [Hymenobacter saemangeumensis]|uniref:Uncharacterized protein n=1 Tax=Hymenobacter saemangeumensis TaxID=1084522 RepID=A0ABP8IRU6_9BACT
MFSSILSPRTLAAGLLLAVAGLSSSCQKETIEDLEPPRNICPEPFDCAMLVTVRDLTGLDGCGKVLVLADGTRLEPTGAVWTNFPSADGQRVLVGYRPVAGGSICMVGQLVEVTCIRPANSNN